MRKVIVLTLLSLILGCSEYKEILRPLRFIPANCYCRYADAAKSLYSFKLSDNLASGMDNEAAKAAAIVEVNKWITETQLSQIKDPRLRCDCNNAAPQ